MRIKSDGSNYNDYWLAAGDERLSFIQAACDYCDNWFRAPGEDFGFCTVNCDYLEPEITEECDDFKGTVPQELWERWAK